MGQRITVHEQEKPIYDICIQKGKEQFYQECDKIQMKNKKVCIVSDTNVSKYYLDELVNGLKNHVKVIKIFIFPFGEESKQLHVVSDLYCCLMEAEFDRSDFLIALGGGVVGDLTGFAAATYLRGVQFIQMPTSLLAMVDSSIGGKTGVDLEAYKNMIGAFHQPKLVYIDLNSLNTLPDREFNSGFGEIVKHGLIKDKAYYQWLIEHTKKIQNKDFVILEEMIARSCEIKKHVVEKDPKEQGERALLNFGHTIGHAIEKIMNFQLLHGECISLGLVAACYISYQRGNLTKEELEQIIQILKSYSLPVQIKGLNIDHVIKISKNDKKMISGKIRFILLKEIGQAIVSENMTQKEMEEAILYLENEKGEK